MSINQNEKQRFFTLFENMNSPSGIFKVVNGGEKVIVLHLNRASRELEKRTPGEFEGKSLKEAFPGVKEIGLIDALKRVCSSGKSEVLDCRYYVDSKVSGWRENFIYKLTEDEVATIYRDLTTEVEASRQLKVYQAALKKLATELDLAEQQQRKKIAVSIHDNLTQSLIMTKMKIEKLFNDLPKNDLKDEILAELEKTIKDTRDLTFDLSSPVLDEFGLSVAISDWMLENVQKKHSINCVFESTTDCIEIDKDVAVSLFRSVKELLFNVIKHSGAKKVKVFCGQTGGHLVIIVTDDGKGFDFNRVMARYNDRGLGLFSVKERIEYLGGSLEVSSEHEKGSEIKIALPLKN